MSNSVEVSLSLEKEKNKFCHHHIISMVCTLIEHSSQPISVWEIAQSWQKAIFTLHDPGSQGCQKSPATSENRCLLG